MYSAVLLSGGKGSRMKRDVPKQYLLLAGKPVIMHSLERLDAIEDINEIVIVCEKKYYSELSLLISQYRINTPIIFAEAGVTRQESTYNGMKVCSNDQIIIHEAARPFVKMDDFVKLINEKNENAIFGITIPFTVIKGENQKVTGVLQRSELVNVQLPQKFNKACLINAHEMAIKENKTFTEDASLLFYYLKTDITIIEGNENNIKITNPIDMLIGEAIYSEYIIGR